MSVALQRDPQCRGSIGGRYRCTVAGTTWLIDGESGCWVIGVDIDSLTIAECAAYCDGQGEQRAWVVSTLAEARLILSELESPAVL